LEAEAVLGVLAACEVGKANLVSSEPLILENERNPHPKWKALIALALDQARDFIKVDDVVRVRAKELEGRGFKAFDALHVACAEAGHVDYFCTCDDRLLKKCRSQPDLNLNTVSPLELANEVSP
jgi:predicted nucleic acid-binding protein